MFLQLSPSATSAHRYLAFRHLLDVNQLSAWLEQRCVQVGRDYHTYLAERHAGGSRRFFTCKAHALYFLQAMAPSRMAEGAWLYGFLRYWRDARFAPLCRIYLKSLGDGDDDYNQVSLYQKLLNHNGCADWRHMSDGYYVQGAIRLALGHNVDQYLPEIIGFNLGYEQVSLSLLIAAYELSECGVQPHYFTLHVSEDDACIASAVKLLQLMLDEARDVAERQALLLRVQRGYKLHQLGMDIPQIAAEFDLQQAFLTVMQPRAAYLERVYHIECMERGDTRSRLSDGLPVPLLMQQLCNEGWMQPDARGNTRLWLTLVRGNCLPQGYELQVLTDWLAHSQEYGKCLSCMDDVLSFYETDFMMVEDDAAEYQVSIGKVNESLSQVEVMEYMIRLMSPLLHHHRDGLKAARIFKSILDKGCEFYQHEALFLMGDTA